MNPRVDGPHMSPEDRTGVARVSRKTLSNAKWQAKNRDKYIAHKRVETAIKSGRLSPKPCERCGETKAVHAHHDDDYSKPLEVIWLCAIHHRERHRELAAIGGPVRGFSILRVHRKLTDEQAMEVLYLSTAAAVAKFGIHPATARRVRQRLRALLARSVAA